MPPEEIKNNMCFFCYSYKNENKIIRKDYEYMTEEEALKEILSFIDNINDRFKIINYYRSDKDIYALVDYAKPLIAKRYLNFYMNVSMKKPYNGDLSTNKKGKMFVYINGKQFELGEQFIQIRPDTLSDKEHLVYDMRSFTSEIEEEEGIPPLNELNTTTYYVNEDESLYYPERRSTRHITLDDEINIFEK